MSPRAIRRAAERKQQKLLKKQNRASALAARPDEPAILSEAKTKKDEPAILSEAKTKKDEPAVLSEAKTQENDAVEREQQKQARKAAQHISDAQLAANRANSVLSTGPTSPDGKAKSSLNAVKTGLTGRTVLLPSDDAAAYQSYVEHFFAEWKPATDAENALVQSVADTHWRLLRIPSLEMAIYALGRLEFANLFEEQDASLRPALIEAHTYLAYQRQLNNLSIQESRLRRQREKDTATLKQLQSERHSRETKRPSEAAAQPFTPIDDTKMPINGFEFSTLPVPAVPERPASAISQSFLASSR